MNCMTFIYTKNEKEISNRVFIPLSVPSDKYFGIDITELNQEQQGEIVEAMDIIRTTYQANTQALMEEYDIKHNLRSFFASKMSNVVEE